MDNTLTLLLVVAVGLLMWDKFAGKRSGKTPDAPKGSLEERIGQMLEEEGF